MKRILLLACLLTSFSLSAQTPIFEWAKQQGGNSWSIATDKSDNVYISGLFSNTVDFDPGPDVFSLTSIGSGDIFVSKLNADGHLVWAFSFGSVELDIGRDIVVDTLGNVYLTGHFKGTVDFDPGQGVSNLSSTGDEIDVFVLKLDTDGAFIWAKNMGGSISDTYDLSVSIALDDNGNVYLTGDFRGTADFDPGSGTYNLISNGSNDIFISKLSDDGDFVWAKSIGASGVSRDRGIAISLDKYNNVYTTGFFSGTTDFDPGFGTHILSTTGDIDLFILKLNNEGDFDWAKSIGGSSSSSRTIGWGIKIDNVGNVYTTGNFKHTVDFDPGANTYNLSAGGNNEDLFIFKLNTNGEFLWAKSIGPGSFFYYSRIALDNYNNIYVTGGYLGDADFDPGPDLFNLSSSDYNTYLLKLNTSGSFIWARIIGEGARNLSSSIVLDYKGNIYTTGELDDIADFDPSENIFELEANSFRDIYIHKMSQPCNAKPLIISSNSNPGFLDEYFVICHGDSSLSLKVEMPSWIEDVSYSWSSGETLDSILVVPDSTSIYTVSANYMVDTFVCTTTTSVLVTLVDSLVISVTDDLELCEQEEALLEANGGVSYLWNTGENTNFINVTAQEDQTFSVTVTDANGCSGFDSLTVTVNPLSDTTHLVFESCDTLAIGSVNFIYPNQNDCDSIVIETTNLIPIPDTPIAPADLVIQEDEPPFQVAVPEVLNATEYFWTVPVGAQILLGSNTNTITIDWGSMVTGGFICVSAINECGISQASCIEVTVDIADGLNEIDHKSYTVFPNPVDGILNVVFRDDEIYEMTLLDVIGRVVVNSADYVVQAQISIKKLPVGNYWLKIFRSDGVIIWEPIQITR